MYPDSTTNTPVPHSPPKVSVLVITYNHDKYIRETLDSALRQKTSFDFEIVVGDDHSQDNTPAILNEYQLRYGTQIRLLLHKSNVGPWENHRHVFNACRGEYVAMLDGDDYWTSNDKLQRQVDVLEQNPDCPMCCHNVRRLFDASNELSEPLFNAEVDRYLSCKDLLQSSPAITSSTLYRRSAAASVDDIPKILLTDRARALAVAHRYGDIAYLCDTMGIWRVHERGVLNTRQQLGTVDRRIKARKVDIEYFETINSYTHYQYQPLISRQVVWQYYALAWNYARRRKWREMFQQIRNGFQFTKKPNDKHTLTSLGAAVRLAILAALQRLKRAMARPAFTNFHSRTLR